MDGWVQNVVLRFNAANLSRGRRNDPVTACNDAIAQFAALSVTVVITLYVVVSLLVSKSWLDRLFAMDGRAIAPIIVASIGLSFWARRAFLPYKNSPQDAEPYKSPSAVKITNVLYVVIPLAWLIMIGLALSKIDPP